jgi:tetratricopeptide (TPR) repeat protein
LSTTPEQFDRDFEVWARAYVAKLRVEPRLSVASAARLRTSLAGKAPSDAALRAAWADQWISVARASFLAGKRVDAEDALRRLKGIEPEPARATLLRAEIALQQDDDERALELFLKAFAAGSEDYRARFTAGKLLDMAGDKPAAIVQMERAAAIFPGWDDPSLSAELELSELYKQQGDEEKALEARERRLDWDAGTLPLRLQVAKAWMERGRPERAIVRLEEALEIDPFVRSIYSDLAAAQEATSDHSGAARAWRMVQKVPAELDVLDNTPADDQLRATWMGREALALARSGQVAEAHVRAQAALQLDPDQAAAKEALDYKE